MKRLFDINLLLALCWPNHEHHRAAQTWRRNHLKEAWATSAITQLGFIRISANPKFLQPVASPKAASEILLRLTRLPNHEYWSDPPSGWFSSSMETLRARVATHNHVTDLFLVATAIHHGGVVATLDEALHRRVPEHTHLVPT